MDIYVEGCLILVGICSLFYWWLTKNFGYLESQKVPVIKKPLPLIGSEDFLLSKPIHQFDQEAYQKFGRVYGLYEGRNATLVIADPDMIKKVFVENFHTCPFKEYLAFNNTHPIVNQCVTNLTNESWRKMHRITTKMFAYEKIKELLPLIGECAEAMLDYTEDLREKANVSVDIHKVSFLFSTSVVAKAIFAIDDDIFKLEKFHPFVWHVRKITNPKIFKEWTLSDLPGLNRIFCSKTKTVNYFVELAQKIFLKRKENATDQTRADFLQFLLDAQEDEEILMHNSLAKIIHQFPQAFTDDFIIAHLVIFVFVAILPITSAITFTAYALAKNKNIQELAAEEIARFVHENDDVVDSSVLAKLRYTDNIIAESLRMYPPLVRNERICVQPYRLRNCVIKPGMTVVVPIYSIHHDPQYYPNPEEFDPNRFSERLSRHQLTYLPFGLGPRKCVGKELAMLEIKMAVVYLLQKYHLHLPSTSEEIKYKLGSIYLKPASTLKLHLTNRKIITPKPSVLLYEKYLMSRRQRRANSPGSCSSIPIPDFVKTKRKSVSAVEKVLTPEKEIVSESQTEEILLEMKISNTLHDYLDDDEAEEEDEVEEKVVIVDGGNFQKVMEEKEKQST